MAAVTVKEPMLASRGRQGQALAPVFNLEADLQAAAFNLEAMTQRRSGGDPETIKSAPVVIYLSFRPFPRRRFLSSRAPVADERCSLGRWFALGPKGSATRVDFAS